jgi:hypothetical protein
MAAGTNDPFNNGVVQGVPSVAVDFNKFAMHVTPRFTLGFKVEDGEGSTYRYARFNANTNRGVLVAQDISESSMGDSDNALLAAASAVTVGDGAIGSRYVQMTASGILINQFAGGKLILSDDTGEGFTYDIIGNTATANTSTGTHYIRIELKQPIVTAVDTTTDVILTGNKYANLEIATNGTDAFLAGVTCNTIVFATASYGWVQTKGIVGILTTGTDVIGEKVVLSTVINGAVVATSDLIEAEQSKDQTVGTCVVDGDTTGHGAYYINLE